MTDELAKLDAVAQADLVRRGEVTPVELVDAAIARIDRLNGRLGAVIMPAFERARRQARSQVESPPPRAAAFPPVPFLGVPFLMKDLGGQEAGAPYHMGMKFLKEAGWSESVDSYIAARLRQAGFISLGRTNTPELGLLPTTEPAAYGPTRNPWNLEHSAGGSSGGAAAAVAAGLVAAAHASDGGGSIRIPAAHCGLVGLKPSRGRSSFGPLVGERWAGFSSELVVTRTVRDTATILDVTAGLMPGDPYSAPCVEGSYAAAMTAPFKRLRIGFTQSAPNDTIVLHPECVTAVRKAARTFERLGHMVDESRPAALGNQDALRAFVTIVTTNTARALDALGDRVGRTVTDADVEPMTWALAELGRSVTATHYLAAVECVHGLGRRMAEWWQNFDLLLTPTTGAPAPRLGELISPPDDPLRGFIRSAPFGAFTSAFNQTGQPAISLPLHLTADGLPVGVQLVAAYGREDVLLRIAAQVEEAFPWRDRRSPMFAE